MTLQEYLMFFGVKRVMELNDTWNFEEVTLDSQPLNNNNLLDVMRNG